MVAIEDLPGARTVTAMDDLGIFGSGSSAAGGSEDGSSGGVSRRTFLSGVVVAGAAAGLASVTEGALSRQPALAATTPPTGPPTTTVPLPTTTAPEQLLLTWGNDPATQVTVSWSAPGTVAQPAPTLSYSDRADQRGPARDGPSRFPSRSRSTWPAITRASPASASPTG